MPPDRPPATTTPTKTAPSLVGYSLHQLRDELRALGQLVHNEWKLFALLLAGLLVFLSFTDPLPPKDVYLAVGQAGSEFEHLGKKFVPYFAEQGMRLHLVNTPGSGASLEDVGSQTLKVNAALMVGGVARAGAYPNLYSLGSVEYVPLWLFYRGEPVQGQGAFPYFSKGRVAIGLEGSATEIILRDILGVTGIQPGNGDHFLKIPHQEAVQKLLDGEIDALCVMDGMESPNVQMLLQRPDLHLYSFSLAAAYVKKLRYLDVVTIPRGGLDLRAVRPEADVQMLASTITLLVERTMHPAVQQTFLVAVDRVSSRVDQFFAKPEFFPAYVDHAVELSPLAKNYFEHGAPPLMDRLPLWLVNYLDRIWLLLLGAFAVIYPLFNLFPSYRRIHSNMFINDAWERIMDIELAGERATAGAELQTLVDQLDELDARALSTFIAADQISNMYSMRATLRSQRAALEEQLDRIGSGQATGGDGR
jgi:uncharacterized protein